MREKIGFDVIPNLFAPTVSNIPLVPPQNKSPEGISEAMRYVIFCEQSGKPMS